MSTHRDDPVIKRIDVNGLDVAIKCSTTGEFWARVDVEILKAPSLKALTTKVREYVRTSRQIAIPVTTIEGYKDSESKIKIRDLTLSGVHGRTGGALVRDEKGKADTLNGWEVTTRRLTGPEKGEFVALVQTWHAAAAAVEAWIEARRVRPSQLVEEAQAAFAAAQAQQGVQAAEDQLRQTLSAGVGEDE